MKTLMSWKKAALVLVDPQVDLLAPEGGAWDLFGAQVLKRGVVAKLVELRRAAAAAGLPIFYSRIEISENDYRDLEPRNGLQKLFAARKLLLEGEGSRFLPELEPGPEVVVLKARKGPSALRSELPGLLRERGLDTIVIAGMVANLCVESQVRDAAEDGFNTIVVGDAIATTSDAAHDGALANFGLLATAVLDTAEILRSIRELES
ncbi:MAG: cysteine hydrolase [Planctomycetes bacterium]|nr:cysteine hydrolase [Planctomycetota bacterium]